MHKKHDDVLAWHFINRNMLRDGTSAPPDGKWLVHKGAAIMCYSGLHASMRPWHALYYAPGTVLCRVQCRHIEEANDDKFVCYERKILARADVRETLLFFARMVALRATEKWSPSQAALDYLMTGEEKYRGLAASKTLLDINDMMNTPYSVKDREADAEKYSAARAMLRVTRLRPDADASSFVNAVNGIERDARVSIYPEQHYEESEFGDEFDALIFEQFGL
jgi:hypothetical protein